MDLILDEVRRDVFEHPKPTIDLDYLYAVKKEIEKYADHTNSQLKKNVYQNYSLFIESSREISTLKEEMRQLNILLEQQQTSMNHLLDQLNKTPIIQPTVEKPEPRNDIFGNLNDNGSNDDDQNEILPQWFVKSPEDFDVHIAQRNLKEAVELVKRIREHFVEYPKCCDNEQTGLKSKIDSRVQELINVISSELQPVTDKSVQGGPRSSIGSIQLLRELNLSSRAVKLYLDLRSSVLRFVLEQQSVETSTPLQFIKQICSIFFHNSIETCNEFKQAFEIDKFVNKAIDECDYLTDLKFNQLSRGKQPLFDLVKPIYQSEHPKFDNKIMPVNGNDISSQILSPHTVKVPEETLMQSQSLNAYNTFNYLSTYASLTYWITLEFENFLLIYRDHVFNTKTPLSLSVIAESIYYLRCRCSKMATYCEIDMSQTLERELSNEIRRVIEDSGRKLIETIKKLDLEEKWQPQQFQNKAEKTRFLEEMNDVGLDTMPKYVPDFKLQFTASKTAFARCYLITVTDLAKLVTPFSKNHVDTVLTKGFEIQIESVIDELSKAKMASKARFIMSNSNFLLDKVIVVACEKYDDIAGQKCQKLLDLRTNYRSKANQVAKMQNVTSANV
uniref:Exocyst complex component 8 n=1 Tax=Aceria tosichella TaxID=561515 RepID=A0A6G1SIE6_9ACAR